MPSLEGERLELFVQVPWHITTLAIPTPQVTLKL